MVAKRVSQGMLSDLQIKSWARTGVPVSKADGGGLTFTLSSAGTSTWVLRYSLAGRRRELTIGNYPDLTLSEARRIAREKRVEIDQGKSPADEKVRAKAEASSAQTTSAVIADYQERKLSKMAKGTITLYSRQLKRIEKAFGSKAARDVAPDDVAAVLKRYVPNGWREVEALLIVTRELFKHASGQLLVRHDPCALVSLEAIAGPRPPTKKRIMLDDEELTMVMNASMNRQNQLSVRILLATAVRVSELSEALKSNIHVDDLTIHRLGTGRWHLPASKTGPAMDIPLAPPVIGWFRELVELSLDSRYILPARSSSRLQRGGGDACIDGSTIWGGIMTWLEESTPAPKVRRFTPHDLRSSAKSHMRALGVGRDISEMCLNHKLSGVEGIYDQYTYWKERREALQSLADYLIERMGADLGSNRSARTALQAAG